MPDEPAAKPPPSPFRSILDWAASWPSWQRDALRRLVRSGELKDGDINELHRICLHAHGVASGATPVPASVHLTEADLPTGPDATSSVTLVSLSQVTNVNRLAGGQVLDFGPATGLTIVFGENGSGKSGYARVVKKACRARGTAPEIRPDALAAGAAGPAQAKIKFRAGAAEVEASWRDGVAADPRLANVFVFDSKSALSHVGDDEPACFTPRGLDVLPGLAEACDELKRRIKAAVDSEFAEIGKARQGWKSRSGTPVGKLLATVGDATADAAVESLAVFADEDKKRLAEIVEALRSDPRRKAQDTTAKATRLRTFAAAVSSASVALGDERMKVVQAAIAECATAEQAARATAGPRFDDSYLPGTGGDAWRRLWAMAEQFSRGAAYPDREFPATEEDARCVLCQRALDDETRARFRGGAPRTIEADEKVDLTGHGPERFMTLKRETQEGLAEGRRHFKLAAADDESLAEQFPKWEAVLDGTSQWVVIREFKLPSGYSVATADLAIQLVAGYPDAALDMAYFSPDLQRADGKAIPALSPHQFDGRNWQRWSRHRTGSNPWVPGEDSLSTHISYIKFFLAEEFKKRP